MVLNNIFSGSGSLGDYNFYINQYGQKILRINGGPTRRQIMTLPSFKKMRENMQEFGSVGRAVRLFREAFDLRRGKKAMKPAIDFDVTGRLVKALNEIKKTDTKHASGKRKVPNGSLELLKGFEFNQFASLDHVFRHSAVEVDRFSGDVVLMIPSFDPGLLSRPDTETHFCLVMTVAAMDFNKGKFEKTIVRSEMISFDGGVIEPLMLSGSLNCGDLPVVVTLEYQIYQLLNGKFYRSANSSFSAMGVVHVDTGRMKKLQGGKIRAKVWPVLQTSGRAGTDNLGLKPPG